MTGVQTCALPIFEYDIDATVEKIAEAGLSPRLAERLKLGW